MQDKYKIVHIPPSGTTQRIQHAWIAVLDDICIGHIHLLREANQRIKFLDAWVHPDYRRNGIYKDMWLKRWDFCKKNFDGYTCYAWAKSGTLPLLLEMGFETGDEVTYVERTISHKPPGEQCFVSC
jgi:hypothetical protein